MQGIKKEKTEKHIHFFSYHSLGKPLTVCLRWVGSDLDEVDSVLVVVMIFNGRSRAAARLLEQERCGHNYQDIDNYYNLHDLFNSCCVFNLSVYCLIERLVKGF